MSPEEYKALVLREQSQVFDRMFGAVEKVRERLERSCNALNSAGIEYAVIGGHAVAAWVATIDDGAVRNTRDVDLLLREQDLVAASTALESVGFVRDSVMDVTVFLDGESGKTSQGIHVLIAGKKVKEDYVSSAPEPDQSIDMNGKRIVDRVELVRMKLNSYCRKDQTHLIDMIQVGLIDDTWPVRFDPVLGDRLQTLIDDPDG